MPDLLEILRSFNRKERYYLIGKALGNENFRLSESFIKELNKVLNINITPEYFSAMDYHLDWIAAGIHLFKEGKKEPEIYDKELITATQEDIDFIICYKENADYHIILIEAKADSSWSNSQMKSKVDRFISIFGMDGNKGKNIIPHVVLMSPDESQKLRTESWPSWMRNVDGQIPYIKLAIPDGLQKVERCDEKGEKSEKGDHWKIV